MGIVDGSIHWNGQDNFQDFIQFAAEKAGMTREEYIATYGFPHKTESVEIQENKKKPGPDPYHRGLDDEEVEDKEAQIKKQAKMDDDDPDAYKEMPGDKEAREKGEVKTSKATKAYNRLYKEGVMSNIHLMIDASKDFEDFKKKFKKDYRKVFQNTPDFMDWLYGMYKDAAPEKVVEGDEVYETAMGYDGMTGLYYFEGVPFTQERLDQVLAWLKGTTVKMGKAVPKQFTYKPAIEIEDKVGGSEVMFDTDKIKYLENIKKQMKGKLAHDEDFNESNQVSEDYSGSPASDKMAFSQLERIIDYATMIRDRMAAGKGLDAWMYGKVIKAEDYLNTLYDVIDGDDGVVETQKMTNKDWKKIKKFNKHVTDSGEKFVMNYDDRIGTFLEPVEIVDEKEVSEAFKFGKKNQYSIDDVNEAYGFWGTLDTAGFKRREIEDCWHSAMAWLTENYRFSDAGALYYLNAKAGRWIADQVIEQKGRKDVVDVLEDYATDSEWKKWSKEYNRYAQEEMMQEATNPVNEEDDKDQKSTDRGPLDDDKIETALKKKAQDTGVPIGIIRAVMRRGLAAWKSGHRPGANQQQWGYARVNAFLTKGEGTWGKADKDLAKEVRDGGHDKKLKKA